MGTVTKQNFNHNAGWTRDLFSDVVSVQGTPQWLFLAGIGPEDSEASDPLTVEIVGDTFEEQCRFIYKRLKTVLAKHGATMHDIVRITGYAKGDADLWTYFKVQGEELDGAPRPPHAFIRVAGFSVPKMLVEIEVTACITGNAAVPQ